MQFFLQLIAINFPTGKLSKFREFDWSFISLQKNMLLVWIREAFGVKMRYANHSELELAPDGAKITLALILFRKTAPLDDNQSEWSGLVTDSRNSTTSTCQKCTLVRIKVTAMPTDRLLLLLPLEALPLPRLLSCCRYGVLLAWHWVAPVCVLPLIVYINMNSCTLFNWS